MLIYIIGKTNCVDTLQRNKIIRFFFLLEKIADKLLQISETYRKHQQHLCTPKVSKLSLSINSVFQCDQISLMSIISDIKKSRNWSGLI